MNQPSSGGLTRAPSQGEHSMLTSNRPLDAHSMSIRSASETNATKVQSQASSPTGKSISRRSRRRSTYTEEQKEKHVHGGAEGEARTRRSRRSQGRRGMLCTHFFQNFIFRYDCNCSEMKGLGRSMRSLSVYRAFIRYPVTQAAF